MRNINGFIEIEEKNLCCYDCHKQNKDVYLKKSIFNLLYKVECKIKRNEKLYMGVRKNKFEFYYNFNFYREIVKLLSIKFKKETLDKIYNKTIKNNTTLNFLDNSLDYLCPSCKKVLGKINISYKFLKHYGTKENRYKVQKFNFFLNKNDIIFKSKYYYKGEQRELIYDHKLLRDIEYIKNIYNFNELIIINPMKDIIILPKKMAIKTEKLNSINKYHLDNITNLKKIISSLEDLCKINSSEEIINGSLEKKISNISKINIKTDYCSLMNKYNLVICNKFRSLKKFINSLKELNPHFEKLELTNTHIKGLDLLCTDNGSKLEKRKINIKIKKKY